MPAPVNELLLELVVDAMKLLAEIRGCSSKKPSQGLGIRKVWEPGQILKGTVGPEKRSGLDTTQAQEDRVDQGQGHLRPGVALVAPWVSQMSAEESPQLQHLNKFVEEVNPAIMRQTLVVTGDS